MRSQLTFMTTKLPTTRPTCTAINRGREFGGTWRAESLLRALLAAESAAEMVQLHGGIGFTWEHEAHRYLKRAKTNQLVLGTRGELRRLIADLTGLR
jgi:hypothetical protein